MCRRLIFIVLVEYGPVGWRGDKEGGWVGGWMDAVWTWSGLSTPDHLKTCSSQWMPSEWELNGQSRDQPIWPLCVKVHRRTASVDYKRRIRLFLCLSLRCSQLVLWLIYEVLISVQLDRRSWVDTTGQVHTKSSALTGRVTRVVTSDQVENEMNETKVRRK